MGEKLEETLSALIQLQNMMPKHVNVLVGKWVGYLLHSSMSLFNGLVKH